MLNLRSLDKSQAARSPDNSDANHFSRFTLQDVGLSESFLGNIGELLRDVYEELPSEVEESTPTVDSSARNTCYAA